MEQAFAQALRQANDVYGGSSGDPILHAADGEDPATTYPVKPPDDTATWLLSSSEMQHSDDREMQGSDLVLLGPRTPPLRGWSPR